jgi:HEAT repeat protein
MDHHSTTDQVDDVELLRVIADFLVMGHVENIVAMYRQGPRYLGWCDRLLTDERFAVRLGLAVLFEYLVADQPNQTHLAIDSLAQALRDSRPWVRGEALNILAIIGGPRALELVRPHLADPDPQVQEVARDILTTINHG